MLCCACCAEMCKLRRMIAGGTQGERGGPGDRPVLPDRGVRCVSFQVTYLELWKEGGIARWRLSIPRVVEGKSTHSHIPSQTPNKEGGSTLQQRSSSTSLLHSLHMKAEGRREI